MDIYEWQEHEQLESARAWIKNYMIKNNLGCAPLAKQMKISTDTLLRFLGRTKEQHPQTVFKIMDWVEQKQKEN